MEQSKKGDELIMEMKILERYVRNVKKIPMSRARFVSTITGARNNTIGEYDTEFVETMGSYGISDYHRALYTTVRVLKPETVIETGVFEGQGSLSILSAMEKNNKGTLYSVDLPSPNIPSEKVPGWKVPEYLKNRWDFRVGKSSDLLPILFQEVEDVDVFLHDSDHSYKNMYFEYEIAWAHIKSDGLLLSHDISQNAAFKDFAKHVSKKYYYMLKNLGGIKRTEI